jgi:hypothetical protein
MFGPGFEGSWYEIPGAPGLELSWNLQFRGPQGLRTTRYDGDGRPYVLARKVAGTESACETRIGMVKLHRAVMSVLLGRRIGSDEFVCHRNDDKANNWPENLRLGDHASNTAESLRNGGRLRGDRHPSTKIKDSQVGEIRLALARGERGADIARIHGVHRSTISRIRHGVRRGSC